MERRLLIVFALTFLVIMLFQPLLKKFAPQPPANQQTQPAQNQAQAPAAGTAATTLTAPIPTPRKGAPANPASRQAAAETETVIENNLYRIVFTNRGGRV